MTKIVVTRDIGEDALNIIKDGLPNLELILWPEDRRVERSWLLENVTGADGILLILSEQVDEELLERAGPNLKVVSTMSVGYEHIDVKAVSRRGIKIGYTPDVLTDAVADISIMLALMASRNAITALDVVQSGRWPQLSWSPFGFCGPQLGAGPPLILSAAPSAPLLIRYTVGFLGFGRISKAVLHRLVPFGITQVLYTSSGRGGEEKAKEREKEDKELVEKYRTFGKLEVIKRVQLDELAKESDLVFVLVPGGTETYHVIDASFLSKMKPTSILINPGRGTTVDSDALAEALNSGKIYGAGLDVVEGEPNVGLDHPLVRCPKAVVLPHIASATTQTRLAMSTLSARNLVAGVLGRELPIELKL